MFYIRDWILDIQSGGKEMQLAMNRLDSPEEHRIRFDGISLEVANFDKEVSDMMTPYYALALQKLSEVSYHGYRSANIDPVNQSTLRKEFGPMSYKKLEHAVARCEQNKQSLLENHGYGPAVFRFFREAGEQGDQLVEKENYDDEMVTAFHKYMISKLQQKYGK
ncbi:MAG: hypothetical protein CMF63_06295 [Magnetovibrio sp.]|nr:hypothetical protein [Magnetovibrio sp.]